MVTSRLARVCSVAVAIGLVAAVTGAAWVQEAAEPAAADKKVELPTPVRKGTVSLEEAIQARRCVRQYEDRALSLAQLSQLLWAANGVTGRNHRFRAAPSAGALHPLDFYAVVGEGSVEGLAAGVWHYEPADHEITRLKEGDDREALARVALGQRQVATAEVVIAVTVEFERSTGKYGDRGRRYAVMDAGFAAENLFLQVQTLGLAACVIGAFRDTEVAELLRLPEGYRPMLLLTVGYPKANPVR